VTLTTRPHLVPRSRMLKNYTSYPLRACMACIEAFYILYYLIMFYINFIEPRICLWRIRWLWKRTKGEKRNDCDLFQYIDSICVSAWWDKWRQQETSATITGPYVESWTRDLHNTKDKSHPLRLPQPILLPKLTSCLVLQKLEMIPQLCFSSNRPDVN
jgi:hypothetical protein